jgi:hypothetical protein
MFGKGGFGVPATKKPSRPIAWRALVCQETEAVRTCPQGVRIRVPFPLRFGRFKSGTRNHLYRTLLRFASGPRLLSAP